MLSNLVGSSTQNRARPLNEPDVFTCFQHEFTSVLPSSFFIGRVQKSLVAQGDFFELRHRVCRKWFFVQFPEAPRNCVFLKNTILSHSGRKNIFISKRINIFFIKLFIISKIETTQENPIITADLTQRKFVGFFQNVQISTNGYGLF